MGRKNATGLLYLTDIAIRVGHVSTGFLWRSRLMHAVRSDRSGVRYLPACIHSSLVCRPLGGML